MYRPQSKGFLPSPELHHQNSKPRQRIRATADNNSYYGFLISNTATANVLTANTANDNTLSGYADYTGTGNTGGGTANYYSTDECSGNGGGGSTPSGLCTPHS